MSSLQASRNWDSVMWPTVCLAGKLDLVSVLEINLEDTRPNSQMYIAFCPIQKSLDVFWFRRFKVGPFHSYNLLVTRVTKKKPVTSEISKNT